MTCIYFRSDRKRILRCVDIHGTGSGESKQGFSGKYLFRLTGLMTCIYFLSDRKRCGDIHGTGSGESK